MKEKLSFIFSEIEAMTEEEAKAVNKAAVARINSCRRDRNMAAAVKFKITDKVWFTSHRDYSRVEGEVIKINVKSIAVGECSELATGNAAGTAVKIALRGNVYANRAWLPSSIDEVEYVLQAASRQEMGALAVAPGKGHAMKRKTYAEALPVMLFASEKIEGTVLEGVAAAKDYCSSIFSQDREMMVVIAMTAKNRVIKRFVHSIGDVDQSAVYARILFRDLLMLAATSFILVHNHPSGDPRPSGADIFLTEDLAVAGKLVGISLLDHLILGPDAYYSFAENELIEKYRARTDNAYRFGLKKVVHERS